MVDERVKSLIFLDVAHKKLFTTPSWFKYDIFHTKLFSRAVIKRTFSS